MSSVITVRRLREAETDTQLQCAMGHLVTKMKEIRKYYSQSKMVPSERTSSECRLEEKMFVSSFISLQKCKEKDVGRPSSCWQSL